MKISKSYSLLATLLMSLSLASCGGGTLKPLNIYKTPETGFDMNTEVKMLSKILANKIQQHV